MKSLHEVVSFLRENMIALPDDFSVKGVPLEGYSEDLLREGVSAFHAYTRDLYTFFIDNADTYDLPLKTAKGDFPTLLQGYPVLSNTFLLLYLMGNSGIANDDGTVLMIDRLSLREGVKGMHLSKIGAIAELLIAQGVEIEGDIEKSDVILMRFPAHRAAPLGLVAMSKSSRRYAKKAADKEVVTERFMMRFDYHVLSGVKNPMAPMEECLGAAPAEVRDFLLKLNDRFVREGCKRQMTPKLFSSKCAYRLKNTTTVFFTIHTNFGKYWVKLNAEHLADYADILEEAPVSIQIILMEENFPCAKKQDPSACSPSCRGGVRFTFRGKECMPCRMGAFHLPVDSSHERDFAERWIDTELAAM